MSAFQSKAVKHWLRLNKNLVDFLEEPCHDKKLEIFLDFVWHNERQQNLVTKLFVIDQRLRICKQTELQHFPSWNIGEN